MPTSLVLGQCENKLWNTRKYLEALTNNFLSVPPSALEVAVGQASAKTNLSFTAVEILKPHQILKSCHSSAVIARLLRVLLMAVGVLIHQGAQIIEAIHLLHALPPAYPVITYCHVIFATDVILKQLDCWISWELCCDGVEGTKIFHLFQAFPLQNPDGTWYLAVTVITDQAVARLLHISWRLLLFFIMNSR